MSSNGILAEITFDELMICLGGNLDLVFQKNRNSHEIKFMSLSLNTSLNID